MKILICTGLNNDFFSGVWTQSLGSKIAGNKGHLTKTFCTTMEKLNRKMTKPELKVIFMTQTSQQEIISKIYTEF